MIWDFVPKDGVTRRFVEQMRQALDSLPPPLPPRVKHSLTNEDGVEASAMTPEGPRNQGNRNRDKILAKWWDDRYVLSLFFICVKAHWGRWEPGSVLREKNAKKEDDWETTMLRGSMHEETGVALGVAALRFFDPPPAVLLTGKYEASDISALYRQDWQRTTLNRDDYKDLALNFQEVPQADVGWPGLYRVPGAPLFYFRYDPEESLDESAGEARARAILNHVLDEKHAWRDDGGAARREWIAKAGDLRASLTLQRQRIGHFRSKRIRDQPLHRFYERLEGSQILPTMRQQLHDIFPGWDTVADRLNGSLGVLEWKAEAIRERLVEMDGEDAGFAKVDDALTNLLTAHAALIEGGVSALRGVPKENWQPLEPADEKTLKNLTGEVDALKKNHPFRLVLADDQIDPDRLLHRQYGQIFGSNVRTVSEYDEVLDTVEDFYVGGVPLFVVLDHGWEGERTGNGDHLQQDLIAWHTEEHPEADADLLQIVRKTAGGSSVLHSLQPRYLVPKILKKVEAWYQRHPEAGTRNGQIEP